MEFHGEEFWAFLGSPLDGAPVKRERGSSKRNLSGEREKKKRGPRTIADNFLLGSRNAWLYFFQECWPEVGWPLERILNRRSSTISDVQKVFEAVRGHPHCSPADVFLRASPRQVTGTELRSNRIKSNNLHLETQRLQTERPQLQLSCTEAENALKEASGKDRESILAEISRRKENLAKLEERLKVAEIERDELDKELPGEEAYWYCAELLDFLRSRRRALNPLNLANALAGLPLMKWRQSFLRCSSMPTDSYTRLPYQIFQAISRIWDRRAGEFTQAPVEIFKAEVVKLPHKHSEARNYLCENWRDLRLAVEECWEQKPGPRCIPFVLASLFMRNLTGQKTSLERVLAAQEKLVSP